MTDQPWYVDLIARTQQRAREGGTSEGLEPALTRFVELNAYLDDQSIPDPGTRVTH